MFSNAQETYNIGVSGNYFFDASGLRSQGSVLNREGLGFIFTNYLGHQTSNSNSNFNLNDTPTPFQYIVRPSSVSNIFNNGIYSFYRNINAIASGVYVYPQQPNPPTLPAFNPGSGSVGGGGSGNL